MLFDLQKSLKRRYVAVLLCSIILHAFFLVVFRTVPLHQIYDEARLAKPRIEIELREIKEIKQKNKKQVVETITVKPSNEAVNDSYLGKQNQVVIKQTQSKNGKTFQSSKESSVANAKHSHQRNIDLAKLGSPFNFKPLGHLSPNEQNALIKSESTTSDYLKNIEQGAQTLLNTKEFAFYSFYQRVRKQLEQYWEPGLKQKMKKMFEQGRSLASEKEHSTLLLVMLNKEGTITAIKVSNTSGFVDLDHAAIEAFNKAGPFPNPPSGLIEKDGTVKIEWEFILKT